MAASDAWAWPRAPSGRPPRSTRVPDVASSRVLASQALRRSLELAVLAAVAAQEDYANQLARRLREAGLVDVNFRQVSATLARLHYAGAVSSFPKKLSSGQTLQHYHLTAEGRSRFEALTEEWTTIVGAMAGLLAEPWGRSGEIDHA